ncbi:MAG: Mpo1-like protein [Deltaproteobacteria bacterium]
MKNNSIKTFDEFWPIYLQLHSKRTTKLFHVVGLILGLILLSLSILTQSWILFGGAFLAGYGFAWFSHFLIEKNRPAAWNYPWWSFISDFRMAFLFLTGKL